VCVPDDDLAGCELHQRVERLEGDERADQPRQRRFAGPRRSFKLPLLRHCRPGPGHRGDDDRVAVPPAFGPREGAAGGGDGEAGPRDDGRHRLVAFLDSTGCSRGGWSRGAIHSVFLPCLIAGLDCVRYPERRAATNKILTR
jgi:hypothetical protein